MIAARTASAGAVSSMGQFRADYLWHGRCGATFWMANQQRQKEALASYRIQTLGSCMVHRLLFDRAYAFSMSKPQTTLHRHSMKQKFVVSNMVSRHGTSSGYLGMNLTVKPLDCQSFIRNDGEGAQRPDFICENTTFRYSHDILDTNESQSLEIHGVPKSTVFHGITWDSVGCAST